MFGSPKNKCHYFTYSLLSLSMIDLQNSKHEGKNVQSFIFVVGVVLLLFYIHFQFLADELLDTRRY